MKSMEDRFEAFSDEYIEFDRVENKRSARPDLHAFLLLEEVFPSGDDIVSAAYDGEIWLGVFSDDLHKLTDSQIEELVRCGVRYSAKHDALCMLV